MVNMKVIEVFDSIQGEGSFVGCAATFIRLAGCNLACPWCDTKESWNMNDGEDWDIMELALACSNDLVIITGGEPCIHSELIDLIEAIKTHGDHFVCIETNGTLPTPYNVDWVVASPKPDKYKLHPMCNAKELKYVVDAEFDEDVITEELRELYEHRIWLQPEGSDMQSNWGTCVEMAMADERLRVGMQLHKLMKVK